MYLINRLPTPSLHLKSPYECLFHETPNYDKLRVFGCLCYPWLRPYTAHKLQPRSASCIFLGYSPTQSAYLCLDYLRNRIFVSRHVQFVEDVFPFASRHPNPMTQSSPDTHPWFLPHRLIHPASQPPSTATQPSPT